MRKHKGFTLIELVIVVAIVAILAAIALPSYQEHVRKERRAQAKADMMELTQTLERKFTVDRSFAGFTLPSSQSPSEGTAQYGLNIVSDATTYTLTATPQGDQVHDRCGTLTVNQLGTKTHSSGDNDTCGWGTAP